MRETFLWCLIYPEGFANTVYLTGRSRGLLGAKIPEDRNLSFTLFFRGVLPFFPFLSSSFLFFFSFFPFPLRCTLYALSSPTPFLFSFSVCLHSFGKRSAKRDRNRVRKREIGLLRKLGTCPSRNTVRKEPSVPPVPASYPQMC